MAMRERIAIGLTVLNLGLLGYQLLPGIVEAQSIPDVVRARAWELVDKNGQPRASLDVAPQGDVVLRLRDESGTIRVKMSASRNGSGLLLLDAATEPGVQIDAGSAGSRVRLTNRDGRSREIVP
jgi:hypothetical protein